VDLISGLASNGKNEKLYEYRETQNWVAGGIIILIWVSLFALAVYYLGSIFRKLHET